MSNVPEDLFGVLPRFHREVALPDMERMVESRLSASISLLCNEMRTNIQASLDQL